MKLMVPQMVSKLGYCYFLVTVLVVVSCSKPSEKSQPKVPIYVDTLIGREQAADTNGESAHLSLIDPQKSNKPETSGAKYSSSNANRNGLDCFNIDTSFNDSIILREEKGILSAFGDLTNYLNVPNDQLPNVLFWNLDSTQLLKMSMWYGGGQNIFHIFSVEYVNPNNISEGQKIGYSNFGKFRTNNRIELGVSFGYVDSVFSGCLSLQEGPEIVLSRIGPIPLYYAKYEFTEDSILYSFEFGYSYP